MKNSSKPAVLIYGVSDVSVEAVAKAAQNLGYQPIFLFSRTDYYDGDVLFKIMEQFAIEYTQPETAEDIATRLSPYYDIRAVISSKDEFIEPSIKLAKKLGVRSICPNSALANQKDFIAKRFPHLCPCTLDTANVSREEISDFLKRFEKVVIKPKRGTDSTGVAIIQGCEPESLPFGDYILQEFVEGRNILIDGAVSGEKLVFWGVSEVSRKFGDTETRYDLPIADLTNSSCYEAMKKSVAEICRSLKIEKSFFHVQYLLGSDDKPMIIDPNFGRIGGSGFSLLLSEALGISHDAFWEGYIKLVAEDCLDKRFFSSLNKATQSVLNFGIECDDIVLALEKPSGSSLFCYDMKKLPSHISALSKGNQGWISALFGPTKPVENYVSKINALTSNGMVPVKF